MMFSDPTSLGGKVRAVSEANDGTGAGLLAFLEWAGKRGEITPTTAKSIAVATGKVLAVEGDPAAVNLRRINADDLFGRFETLNRMSYTTESMSAYRSRFFKAVSMYLAWLDKRPDWKTASQRAPGKALAVRPAGNGNLAAATRATRQRRSAPATASSLPDGREAPAPSVSESVVYDLPLRPGLRVRLVLPEMLTQADAKRIAAFVNSLAFDQAAEGPEGAG